MRVTSKGQVTIPREIRHRLGISTASEVEFVVEGNTVVLRTIQGEPSKGKRPDLFERRSIPWEAAFLAG